MISAPFAHIGGVPVEETLGSLGPALLVAFGVAWAQLRALLRPVRSRASAPARSPRAVQPDRSDAASSDVKRPSGRETTARRERRRSAVRIGTDVAAAFRDEQASGPAAARRPLRTTTRRSLGTIKPSPAPTSSPRPTPCCTPPPLAALAEIALDVDSTASDVAGRRPANGRPGRRGSPALRCAAVVAALRPLSQAPIDRPHVRHRHCSSQRRLSRSRSAWSSWTSSALSPRPRSARTGEAADGRRRAAAGRRRSAPGLRAPSRRRRLARRRPRRDSGRTADR